MPAGESGIPPGQGSPPPTPNPDPRMRQHALSPCRPHDPAPKHGSRVGLHAAYTEARRHALNRPGTASGSCTGTQRHSVALGPRAGGAGGRVRTRPQRGSGGAPMRAAPHAHGGSHHRPFRTGRGGGRGPGLLPGPSPDTRGTDRQRLWGLRGSLIPDTGTSMAEHALRPANIGGLAVRRFHCVPGVWGRRGGRAVGRLVYGHPPPTHPTCSLTGKAVPHLSQI